jgi:hypothetical protein
MKVMQLFLTAVYSIESEINRPTLVFQKPHANVHMYIQPWAGGISLCHTTTSLKIRVVSSINNTHVVASRGMYTHLVSKNRPNSSHINASLVNPPIA